MIQITKDPQRTKSVSEVSVKKFYGVDNGYGNLGFITREGWNSSAFTCRLIRGLTEGNSLVPTKFNRNTLRAMVENLIDHDYTVYEFSTFRELAEWLKKSNP